MVLCRTTEATSKASPRTTRSIPSLARCNRLELLQTGCFRRNLAVRPRSGEGQKSTPSGRPALCHRRPDKFDRIRGRPLRVRRSRTRAGEGILRPLILPSPRRKPGPIARQHEPRGITNALPLLENFGVAVRWIPVCPGRRGENFVIASSIPISSRARKRDPGAQSHDASPGPPLPRG